MKISRIIEITDNLFKIHFGIECGKKHNFQQFGQTYIPRLSVHVGETRHYCLMELLLNIVVCSDTAVARAHNRHSLNILNKLKIQSK
jgi:hypothetical protein